MNTSRRSFTSLPVTSLLSTEISTEFELRRLIDYFFHGATARNGLGPPHYPGFTITLKHTTLGRTSDKPDAETTTWQHTTLTRDGHPCPWRDSNPESQQPSGHWDRQIHMLSLNWGVPALIYQEKKELMSTRQDGAVYWYGILFCMFFLRYEVPIQLNINYIHFFETCSAVSSFSSVSIPATSPRLCILG
jgi:hypothetical protein